MQYSHIYLTEVLLTLSIEHNAHDKVITAAFAIFKRWPDEAEIEEAGVEHLSFNTQAELLARAKSHLEANGYEWDENPKHGIKITKTDQGTYWSANCDTITQEA